jgi:hypothetical protein
MRRHCHERRVSFGAAGNGDRSFRRGCTGTPNPALAGKSHVDLESPKLVGSTRTMIAPLYHHVLRCG